MRLTLRTIVTGLVLFSILGFRTFDDHNTWKISRSTTASRKLFVVYDSGTQQLTNDLPSSDPLAGTSPITVADAMSSIFDDYNNIQASYLTLVDENDSDYASESEDRIIHIFKEATDGANAGEARTEYEGKNTVDCRISLATSTFKSAKEFLGVVTHEIGHCLGLGHPQDTEWAIMSYFGDRSSRWRLQIDDKMGITFLYPMDPSKAKEEATYGLSCARR